MKKYIYILLTIALLAIVVFKLAKNKTITESKVYNYDKDLPIIVESFIVKSTNLLFETEFSGTFEPNREVKVNADISGKISEVFVDLGSQVQKNQALIQLDNSILKLQLAASNVQIEGLVKDVNRFSVLAKAEAIQGVQLEKAQIGLDAAKIQRDILLEQISKSAIRAPFDGFITSKYIEVGAFAAPGVPLFQLTDIQYLRFTIQVSEVDIDKFKVEDVQEILSDNYPDLKLSGKVIAVGSKSNPAGSFPVQFLLENTADTRIKSGMFGKAIIKAKGELQSISIPTAIIQGSEDSPAVYLVKDGKAILQKISIKEKVKDQSIISSGIKEGDELISKGFINLFEGANITNTVR